MNSINHLPPEEQKHFIRCGCGAYVDMRNLADVFMHFHEAVLPTPQWTSSRRIGEAISHDSNGGKQFLN